VALRGLTGSPSREGQRGSDGRARGLLRRSMQESYPSGKNTQRRRIPRHPLRPLRPLTVITERGPTDLAADQVTAPQVGCKAYGLISLPPAWVPPFFVILAPCFEDRSRAVQAWADECARRVGIQPGRQVMVRSSATWETLQNRGRLESRTCSADQVEATIRALRANTSVYPDFRIHWVVQEHVATRRKGQLCNERRLSHENRDWVAEFEPGIDLPGRRESIAVRPWRDGTELKDLDLSCSSEVQVSFCLKRVAIWGTQLARRTLFEWVWDGRIVRIVQADEAEPHSGVDPRSLVPAHIPAARVSSLKVFRLACEQDYDRLTKLQNARLYKQIGYDMPAFYVVDDKTAISDILAGQITPELDTDLAELTARPLVIRTDGTGIPYDRREMLPRSEDLRSAAQARDWLLGPFRKDITRNQLVDCDLSLIAHHFIPSVASAWARAEPGNRIVRIESLWGVPEGLYWHAHDTFEVDTQKASLDFGELVESVGYKCRRRLRYKGTFIAPDDNGRWVAHQPRPPFDWGGSISKTRWLWEVARTTRHVAEVEKYPVSLMWFIDNHPEATRQQVLPWFHTKSEIVGPPRAAPRRKLTTARDFNVKGVDDWQRLKQFLESGNHIERVVVEPTDPELIRNSEFARELAALAAAEQFVVELSGGVLSHAYYILQRSGARVECADLFGADEEVIEYNKVVRDKVPDLIRERGERVQTVRLEGDALVAALRQKLVEEAFEALDAPGVELLGELADLEEVIRALSGILNVDEHHIGSERTEKRRRRGGFDKGFMLIKTVTPHSIRKPDSTSADPLLELRLEPESETVISDEAELPSKALYRRPDLRQFEQHIEKLFTFETEASKLGSVKATVSFSLPLGNGRDQDFSLTVELQRMRSSLRGVVRLRPALAQLPLEFPD
jgi:predicted house-cleaning noncanonical NTP pyrophosphatase (MazG superfamily)